MLLHKFAQNLAQKPITMDAGSSHVLSAMEVFFGGLNDEK